MLEELLRQVEAIASALPFDERMEAVNKINQSSARVNPLGDPIKCVQWVKMDKIFANEWNPNKVAPPEMRLLYDSIKCDGYTQPVVAKDNQDTTFKVVDGFHRNEIGKTHKDIREKLHEYLPIVPLEKGTAECMASTIRHNRARGSHDVDLMSNIVAELHKLGRNDQWIAKHLGMDADEILRLKQITGLAEAFKNNEFGMSWENID